MLGLLFFFNLILQFFQICTIELSEAVVQRRSVKMAFFEISQNSEGNIFDGSSFNKVLGLGPAKLEFSAEFSL